MSNLLFALALVLLSSVVNAEDVKCYSWGKLVAVEKPTDWTAEYAGDIFTWRPNRACAAIFPAKFSMADAPILFRPSFYNSFDTTKWSKRNLDQAIEAERNRPRPGDFSGKVPQYEILPSIKTKSGQEYSLRGTYTGGYQIKSFALIQEQLFVGVFEFRNITNYKKFENYVQTILDSVRFEKSDFVFSNKKARAEKDLKEKGGVGFIDGFIKRNEKIWFGPCAKKKKEGLKAVIEIAIGGSVVDWINENESVEGLGSCLKQATRFYSPEATSTHSLFHAYLEIKPSKN